MLASTHGGEIGILATYCVHPVSCFLPVLAGVMLPVLLPSITRLQPAGGACPLSWYADKTVSFTVHMRVALCRAMPWHHMPGLPQIFFVDFLDLI